MVRRADNKKESSTSLNLTAGQGVKIEGTEIKIDPTSVTLDTETQQLQTQVNTVQTTANTANSKADLLGTVQSGLVANINLLLPYYDTTYTTTDNYVRVQSRDTQQIWYDRSLIWTNTKTNETNLELPNGMYQCKFRTLLNSSDVQASENHRLWQFYGMFNWIKLDTVNDSDSVPRILEPVSYYHTQNQLSTEADMKISIVRVPVAAGAIVPEWKAFFKFGDGIPLENETTIKLEFTMRKIFDT
jgi:hypothetical protein